MKLFKNGTVILIISICGLLAIVGAEIYLDTLKTQPYTPQEIAQMGYQRININTASTEELAQLPSLTEKQAQSIVEYREENGSFSDIEELLDVKGIGETTYRRIEAYITLE